jgi:hypothetical protein
MAVVRTCERVAVTDSRVVKRVPANIESDAKYSGQLPKSISNEARALAEAQGVSLEQFVAAAVAEKIAALNAPESGKWNTGHWRRPGSVKQT